MTAITKSQARNKEITKCELIDKPSFNHDGTPFSRVRRAAKIISGNIKSELYNEYLKSKEWYVLRELIMKRDNCSCRVCSDDAEEVHHLTYTRIFNESPYDLIAICRKCHDFIHHYT
jgi:hypothetical protein